MTRLNTLAQFLNIPKEMFFTRNSAFTKFPVDETEDEFILKENGMDRYYNIYASDEEIDQRLEEMKTEFGDEIGDDIENALTFLGESNGYRIYTN